jgi:hypothetical protein
MINTNAEQGLPKGEEGRNTSVTGNAGKRTGHRVGQ